MRQILAGLKQMHDLEIVHRDIKPDNLIFTQEEGKEIKFIDFGISK
jgi:serine/threonine protein kinase